MLTWKRIKRSDFFIKLRSWEYWPFGIVQFPAIMYYLWLSLRARSFIFFSAANPGIEMGGMFGESKYGVLSSIPSQFVPRTTIVKLPSNAGDVQRIMDANGFTFPVIFKPDIGERGFMVKRINNAGDLQEYLLLIRVDFLIQELVDLPEEFGIFYTRFPDEPNGEVTSVVMKEMLAVTGDGSSSLRELILNKDRAKLQWHRLQVVFKDRLAEIIPNGQSIQLGAIGNHALGTKFLDGSKVITPQLSKIFDEVSKRIPGFYFGRFDLRAQSLDHLYRGEFRILELNGCGAEPAHIYDPGFSFFKATRVLMDHWKTIFLIAQQNRKRGSKFTSVSEAYQAYSKFKEVTR